VGNFYWLVQPINNNQWIIIVYIDCNQLIFIDIAALHCDIPVQSNCVRVRRYKFKYPRTGVSISFSQVKEARKGF